jgi:hypothetical protein
MINVINVMNTLVVDYTSWRATEKGTGKWRIG